MASDNDKAKKQFVDFWRAEENLSSIELGEVRALFETEDFQNDPYSFFTDVGAETADFAEEVATARTLTEILLVTPDCDLIPKLSAELGDTWDDYYVEHIRAFADKVFDVKLPAAESVDEDEDDDEVKDDEPETPDETKTGKGTTGTEPQPEPEADTTSRPEEQPKKKKISLVELLGGGAAPAASQALPPPRTRRMDTPGYRIALAMAEDIAANRPELLPAVFTKLGSAVGHALYGFRECEAVLDYLDARGRLTPEELEKRFGKP